jgi:hypothetical protein
MTGSVFFPRTVPVTPDERAPGPWESPVMEAKQTETFEEMIASHREFLREQSRRLKKRPHSWRPWPAFRGFMAHLFAS